MVEKNLFKENMIYRFLTQDLPEMELSNVEFIYTFGKHLAVWLDKPTLDYRFLLRNFKKLYVVQHGKFVTDFSKFDPRFESIVIIPKKNKKIWDTFRVLPNQHP